MLQQLAEQFQSQGFALASSLFSQQEVNAYKDHYAGMHARGGDGWAETPIDMSSDDPLKQYPRLLQPHRGDKLSLDFMLEPRLYECLKAIAGAPPLAVQTMVYFRPPQSKGQNLHQDNMYLQAEPGTCMAAWLALDDIDEQNGCLLVVPGTHDMPVLCQIDDESNLKDHWFTRSTPIPEGFQAKPMIMKAGDVLFFNGSLIHGSNRNETTDRFRRTLIAHYISGEAEQVAKYYFPVYREDGSIVESGLAVSAGGGPCGVFQDGQLVYEGENREATAAH